ncbi:queuosine precursor transporter [Candidatus Xianfuyuplasma coldseepsis]|uniref:Probable queuosine precursor transporter n=1 Tax=Candidatus Xianfuyuplasma coldseepsis TaxID=2782163 RepID=A0A7L7KUC3_9MOLU|nr:queuosine precursor transporter [Xianfuyuplasma coldseepsis]QMS85846.1 queuosine precursor transporter [Xianfuyuplasma coldseepsis]
MSNELLWLLFAMVNFILIVGMYKLFGKTGLFAWIALGTIIANIQVTKTIMFELGDITIIATLGNIMYGTLFLITDTLSEKYGHKMAKKAVYIGFYSLLATVIIMQMAIAFNPLDEQDIFHIAIVNIFDVMPQIAGASLLAYIVSQLFDVFMFQKIRSKFPADKYLWLRNNGSTMLSQLIDTTLFVPLAFIGWQPWDIIGEIFITTYIIKVIVAMLDTPFVYLMKRITPLPLLNEE